MANGGDNIRQSISKPLARLQDQRLRRITNTGAVSAVQAWPDSAIFGKHESGEADAGLRYHEGGVAKETARLMMSRLQWQRKLGLLLVGVEIGIATQAMAQMKVQPNGPPPASAEPASPVTARPAAPTSATETQPSAPREVTVPAGTRILLTLKSAINTKTAQPGDGVYLTSSFPVVVDGQVVIPPGAYVKGVIDRVKRPGRIHGRAKVGMHFTSIIFPDGKVVSLPGTVDSLPGSDGPHVTGREGTVEQAGTKAHDAGNVAKGAAIGAEAGTVGGAVSGNWAQGLGYGALAGAGAGAIYTLFSRGKDIVIPEGANIEMVLDRPLKLEPQQYSVVHDQPTPQAMAPAYTPAPQPAPLPKPEQHN